MTAVICDACKKTVPSAQRDLNYKSYLNKAICPGCDVKLEQNIRSSMASNKTYDFHRYKKIFNDELIKICK